eukprot:CAMPEP_0118931652 /NCGR_PEP_ID=MMETSP1169-20130426/7917_1 /TAXON_ID=36882 /ORGANISM="Pyramimonas obovata, Strain CCMP722" /LENGTH=295 /DNA_ID=CAMNT_0006874175 /DNA_START=363 /DNA_END=1250 /DNA_ORIENTATION=+
MYYRGQEKEIGQLNLKTALLFSLPGLLYFVNNNIPFYCLMYLDPPSYQVLQQLKIGTTAVAFRLLMGRKLTSQKWVALGLLLLGCALSQLKWGNIGELFASSSLGYTLVTMQCSISATAAVISEKLLKETKQSIHLQNLQMYLYGVLFSCMNMYAEGVAVQHWARGYNFWAVMSVLCLSLTGLATSAVMKYADNLIKVFALAGSMIFTTVASALLFGTVITLLFMLGTLVACLSCYLYFAEDSRMFDVLDNCGGVCNMAMAGDAPVVTYSGPKDARVMSDSLKEPLNMKRDKEEP